MEARGPNSPVTPTPPVPAQQTPLAAPLPSLAEHTAVLLHLQAALNSAAAKLAEFARAEQVARDDPAGSSRGDGDRRDDGEHEAVERSVCGEGERLGEEAEELGKEVERILGEAQGMWAGVERLRLEMDQWATEIVCSSQARQRVKGRLEELGKEDERLLAEMGGLSLQDEVVKWIVGGVEQWYPPRRRTQNRAWDEVDERRAERIRVREEAQKLREELDGTELERERLIMGLATVLSEKVKVEAEARASVVETERLRVEVERLAAEVVQLKVEAESKRAPRD